MIFTRADHRARTGGIARGLANVARRVSVALSSGGQWQFDGVDEEDPFLNVPAFQGIGFASRPSGDTEAEALLVRLGGNDYAAVGFRDEDIRLALEQGETAIFNKAGASVKLTEDGDVIVTPASGRKVLLGGPDAADPVARQSDLQALATVFDNWIVAATDGGGALKSLLTTLTGGGWPEGSSVVDAE